MSIRKNVALMICLFVSTSLFAQTWTRGNFEIHVFQVGQADSQLIISPSGRTLLIDLGETAWNSTQNATAVAQKIHNIMGANFNRLDYIVTTHLHADHIGYTGRGGIWGLLNTHGFTVGTLIDRDSGLWADADSDNAYDDGEITWRNAGNISGTMNNWLPFAQTLNRDTAIVGSTTQIDLGPNIIVTVIQSDGQGVMMQDGHRMDDQDWRVGIIRLFFVATWQFTKKVRQSDFLTHLLYFIGVFASKLADSARRLLIMR